MIGEQTLILDEGKWSALHPGCFTPKERALGEPQSQSGCSDGEKNPYICWELHPTHPAHSLVTILPELSCLLLSYWCVLKSHVQSITEQGGAMVIFENTG
jgi:hypothetical protein